MQACALFISASVRVGHVEPDRSRAATAALDAAPRPGVAPGRRARNIDQVTAPTESAARASGD